MITVIGVSCIDIIATNVSKNIFESGHEFADNIQMNFGGDGLNESIILSRLNNEVEFITTVGNDNAGKSIVQHCLDNNVKIIPTYKSNTYISSILVDKDGNRNLIGTKKGSLREFSIDDISEINGEIVSFASLFMSYKFPKEDLEKLFTKIKNDKRILCADTTTIKNNETVEEYKNVLNKIDYFFPNDFEAKLFTRAENVEGAAEILFKAGVKNVIIKCGEKGCYIRNDDMHEYVNTISVKAIDTTGAGDSFVSGFIHMLNKGKDIIECANFANECGRKATQVIGSHNWL